MKELNTKTTQDATVNTVNASASEAAGSNPPLGRFYTVEGRRLVLYRSGSGGPAVVFLPGAGMIGLDFLNIHEQVAQFTTSVLYDRAGTGWSDQAKLPRTAAAVTDELRAFLCEAGVPAPYVLVGHSLGGAYAQHYAKRFSNEVAGLLLIEPTTEDFFDAMPKPTVGDQIRGMWASLRLLLHFKAFYRAMYARAFALWPQDIRVPLIDWHMNNLMKTLQEWPNSDRTVKGALPSELRNGGRLPNVPLIVLCTMGIDPSMEAVMSSSYLRRMNDGKRAVFTALANTVPGGEYREIEDAGHTFLHIDNPDVVMQAIRDLLKRM